MSSSTSDFEFPDPIKESRAGYKILATSIGLFLAITSFLQIHAWEGAKYLSPFRFQLLQAEKTSPHTIALGNSLTGMGFCPNSTGVYCLGYDGEDLQETRIKVGYLLGRLPRLKRVYLQFVPFNFLDGESFENVRPPYRKLDACGEIPVFLTPWLVPFDPIIRPGLPGYTIKRLLGVPLKRSFPEVLENGTLDYSGKFIGPLEPKKLEPVKSHFSKRFQQIHEEILEILLARGIEVALTQYPTVPSYREKVMRPDIWRDFQAYKIDLLARYPSLISTGSLDAFDGDPDLFANHNHLNLKGARRYWEIIAKTWPDPVNEGDVK